LQFIFREFDPDVVILEELWLQSYLRAIRRSGRPWIYDAHNVELMLQPSRFLRWKVHAIEGAVVRRATQIWTCSAQDQELLRLHYGRSDGVRVIPNTVDVCQYSDEAPGRCRRLDGQHGTGPALIYTASFSYPPNALAAQILIEELYPRIKATYPECRLVLVGNRPTEQMLDAARADAGIIVTGRVPDVRPYLAGADVVVVPLMNGGGTRLKILEGFAARRPVVSTSKGAEGLDATNRIHLLVRDGVEEIADGVKQILMHPELRNSLVRNAYDLVKSRYSWEALYPQVREAVAEAL
jgi:glycosyltransferase involved in cell wall biosynthesis